MYSPYFPDSCNYTGIRGLFNVCFFPRSLWRLKAKLVKYLKYNVYFGRYIETIE